MALLPMIRTQIQFNEEQVKALKAQASRDQVSIAEIVRRAVDAWRPGNKGQDLAEERRRLALAVVGQFASGQHDIARRHDDYLAETWRG